MRYKLSLWAKHNDVSYSTAYRWFKQGKLPVSATQTETGTILIDDENFKKEDKMMTALQKITNGSNKQDALLSMLDDATRLFNVLESTNWENSILKQNTNRFKTLSEKNQYVIVGEIPGFAEDEINVSVKNNVLMISGNHDIKKEDERYFSKETASFESSYTLPANADIENISAEHKNGVLQIMIPKISHQAKQIQIKQLKK